MARSLLFTLSLEGSMLLRFSAPFFSANSVSSAISALKFLPFTLHRPAIAGPNSLRVWITRKIASRVTIPTMCAEPSSPCVTTGI